MIFAFARLLSDNVTFLNMARFVQKAFTDLAYEKTDPDIHRF